MSETRGPMRGRRLAAGRRLFDDAYTRADRMLDRGQHHAFRVLWFFLPETSIARDLRFQQVMASRFFSDAGQQALLYGALVAIVRGGGGALQAALVGVATLVPAAALGLYGGAVADAIPKRVALAAVYNLQALLCFLVPTFFGTDLGAVLVLVFAVNALGQVSGPTENAVLPLVASEAQLASAASLVSLASNVGTAFGAAVFAPVLVRVVGVRAVFYVSGVLLLIAASRVFDLPSPHRGQRFEWRKVDVRAWAALRWLAGERAVATMMFVAVLAGTVNVVVQTLAPRYVQAVLRVDPAEAVYVFAPSAAGMLLALAAGPPLIRRRGERIVALGGFVLSAAVLSLLGLVDQLSASIGPLSPLRIVEPFGLRLSDELRTAATLALPLGFGLTTATTAVQTYINRRVPLAYQGRAFALQSTIKNGVAVLPLLTLGAAASSFGVAEVLVVSPLILLALAVALVRLSFAFAGQAPSRELDVLSTFWTETGEPVRAPVEREGSAGQPPPGAERGDDPEHHNA